MDTPKPEPRLLIIRLSSIGDIAQCSAAARALKLKFPSGEIHWVVRSEFSDLVQAIPSVDRVIPFDKKQGLAGWLHLARELNSKNYTHVYDAHNNLRSHILCWRIRSPHHLIRRSKQRLRRLLLFALKWNTFAKPYKPFRAVDSYVTPLAAWGVINDGSGSELHQGLQPTALPSPILPKAEHSPWIALAPGAAWPLKRWPLNSWKQLISLICERTTWNIAILGGPSDHFCNELLPQDTRAQVQVRAQTQTQARTRPQTRAHTHAPTQAQPQPRTDAASARIVSFQGTLSIIESGLLAKQCAILVTADSGLLHVTEALGQRVLALLGPTPFGAPFRSESLSIQRKLWCSPCSKDGSFICYNLERQKCMKLITPEEVFLKLQQVLQQALSSK
jgi:ADP-heptose:LPS heptosyltransferase